jgi:hypothetical protein
MIIEMIEDITTWGMSALKMTCGIIDEWMDPQSLL